MTLSIPPNMVTFFFNDFFLVGEKFKDSKSEYILTSYSNFAPSIAAASTQTQDIGKCLALWFEAKCLLHHPFQFLEDNLGVMSVGFLLSSPDDAVIWRGPKKNGLSLRFLLSHPSRGKSGSHPIRMACVSGGLFLHWLKRTHRNSNFT